MEIEVLGKATRREIDFRCPECGKHNNTWVNKKAKSDAEKTIHKVILYCWACNAMLTVKGVKDE